MFIGSLIGKITVQMTKYRNEECAFIWDGLYYKCPNSQLLTMTSRF